MGTSAIDRPSDILLGPPSPDRYGDWLQGPRGNRLYPFDMRAEDLDIRDIAQSLSAEPRWCNFTRATYSVAEHSWRVSMLCDPADALWGIAHDFPEYIFRDLPAPIKHMPEMAGYRLAEANLMRVVCDWLGLDHEMPESVRKADKMLGALEARELFDELDPGWSARLRAMDLPAKTIIPWSAALAEEKLTERFHKLTGGRFR